MSAPAPVVIDPIVVPATLLTNPSAITDEVATVTVASLPRPGYLVPRFLPGYGTKITRIGGDYNTTTAIGGKWGKVALHHYSKNQPWNDDLSMVYIEQRSPSQISGALPANSPDKLILDGSSYLPIIGNRYTSNNSDLLHNASEFRWRPGYPRQAIGWKNSTQTLTLFDMVSQTTLFTAYIPSDCVKGSYSDGFGLLSEGVISNDGRYLVLCSRYYRPQLSTSPHAGRVDHFCVVDLEAALAGVSYPNAASTSPGVGPMKYLNGASEMTFTTEDYGDIDFCSISPLGNYVIVKYSSSGRPEYARCFTVNLSTLVCTPKAYANFASFVAIAGGATITGAGIPALTTVSGAVSPGATSLTMSANATATAANITLTIAGTATIRCNTTNGSPTVTILDTSLRSGAGAIASLAGWMMNGSHGDFAISADPALTGSSVEVYVAGIRNESTSNYCSSAEVAAHGKVIAQSMATGKHIHISMGTTQLGGATEAADQHASGRCYLEPTTMLMTYEHHATYKFGQHGGEMVLWSTLVNGGGAPIRCGCTFTDDNDSRGYPYTYLGEAHAVPSPGCEKIMFASNWQKNASPVGPVDDYKSYILEPASTNTVEGADYTRREPEVILRRAQEPPYDSDREDRT